MTYILDVYCLCIGCLLYAYWTFILCILDVYCKLFWLLFSKFPWFSYTNNWMQCSSQWVFIGEPPVYHDWLPYIRENVKCHLLVYGYSWIPTDMTSSQRKHRSTKVEEQDFLLTCSKRSEVFFILTVTRQYPALIYNQKG